MRWETKRRPNRLSNSIVRLGDKIIRCLFCWCHCSDRFSEEQKERSRSLYKKLNQVTGENHAHRNQSAGWNRFIFWYKDCRLQLLTKETVNHTYHKFFPIFISFSGLWREPTKESYSWRKGPSTKFTARNEFLLKNQYLHKHRSKSNSTRLGAINSSYHIFYKRKFCLSLI